MQLSVRELAKRYKTGEGVSGINIDIEKASWSPFLALPGAEKPPCCGASAGFSNRTPVTS